MKIFSCVDNIFKKYDYNNIPIKRNILENHNTKENAWISINNNVYSIRKDDIVLLDIFKNLYGQNVNKFIINNNLKDRIILLEKLQTRKIGYLV